MEPETLELALGETKEIRVWAFPTEVRVYKVLENSAVRIVLGKMFSNRKLPSLLAIEPDHVLSSGLPESFIG